MNLLFTIPAKQGFLLVYLIRPSPPISSSLVMIHWSFWSNEHGSQGNYLNFFSPISKWLTVSSQLACKDIYLIEPDSGELGLIYRFPYSPYNDSYNGDCTLFLSMTRLSPLRIQPFVFRHQIDQERFEDNCVNDPRSFELGISRRYYHKLWVSFCTWHNGYH